MCHHLPPAAATKRRKHLSPQNELWVFKWLFYSCSVELFNFSTSNVGVVIDKILLIAMPMVLSRSLFSTPTPNLL